MDQRSDGRIRENSRTALESAADSLRRGEIVAVRGIGGYQLLVDATSASAVLRLRQRKRRPAKPLAVMCRTLAETRKLARLSDEEESQLCSSVNPIVLVRQHVPSALAREINSGLSDVGLMLPATTLHDRLLELTERPLVCTSGNLEGDPLAFRVDESQRRLSGVADVFLHHDRDIHRPIDDSVVRVIADRAVTIRAGRGLAPLPIALPDLSLPACQEQRFLACGGYQKSAVALARGGQAMLSPHVGDLDTLTAQERWIDQVGQLVEATRDRLGSASKRRLRETSAPESDALSSYTLICDPHPGYYPTNWAEHQAACLRQTIWHHHAHVVSGLLEHGWLDREVLGVAWDGTGLGSDGTIWGGEFLRATATRFERVAHLRPFVLPGGEAAIRDLRRLTLAVLSQIDELTPRDLAAALGMPEQDVRRHLQVMNTSFSPKTTSCGRLFDAAACLILNRSHAAYEGQAAMSLEAACDLSASGAYRIEISGTQPKELDWRPVMRDILKDHRAGTAPGIMAMRFHRGLARAMIELSRCFPELPTVLGGGVFQNRVLVELIVANWPVEGQPLGLPGLIPPNDGGLAAGQLAAAMASTVSKEVFHVSGSSRSTRRVDRLRSAAGHGGH